MSENITPRQFEDAEGTEDWRVLGDGAHAFFATGSLAGSARLAQAIGELDGTGPGRPDLDLRDDGVTARLVTATEESFGMTIDDVDLASRISGAARRLGFAANPSIVQSVLPIVIDALDIPGVMPFWQALLGYIRRPDSPDEDLVDPRGRGPSIWFQQMDEPRSERNRLHFACWVPAELAEARVQAAIAAGGVLVTDRFAPDWWVLADAEGNEADVATALGRG
ncbi:MAG TPA: VOC family protein [Candidatus Limnocylindria bacterium]|nr:VOC family protein [Candidatus Limnocylindria bacterium]